MNKKDTSYYTVYPYNYCSYCHCNLIPYDDMDEYGGWNYSYYQCDCEQAKIEYQMNEEIEIIEKEIQKIRDKYANQLVINYNEVRKNQYKEALKKLKEEYGIDQPEYDEEEN